MAINCPGPICSPLLGASVTGPHKVLLRLFDVILRMDGKLSITCVHVAETIRFECSFEVSVYVWGGISNHFYILSCFASILIDLGYD